MEAGIDIENIDNIKIAIKSSTLLNNLFSKKEINYCKKQNEPENSFAEKFCAKEAIIKAYKKRVDIKTIEIINLKNKELEVRINGKVNNKIKVGISNTNEYAIAIALIKN